MESKRQQEDAITSPAAVKYFRREFARELLSSRALRIFILGAAALSLRVIGLSENRLWLDELLSVNFSHHGLAEVLITVVRFDTHTPLYYLQLAVWMLFGTSDEYLMLNSVLWGVLGVISLYIVAERMMRPAAAFLAGMLLAVSPAAVFYSQQVRMYSFVMFLCIISFHCSLRFIETRKTSDLLATLLAMLAVVYSHGAGLIMIVGVSAYWLFRASREADPVLVRKIVLGHAILVLMSLPAVVFALNRAVTHTLVPDAQAVTGTLRFLIAGIANDASALPLIVTGAVIGALCVVCLMSRTSRPLFVTTFLLPIMVVLAVSHIFSPIWLERTLLFTVPFLCLSIALLFEAPRPVIGQEQGLTRWLPAAAAIAILVLLSVEQQSRYSKGDDSWAMARFIETAARPGDFVVVNSGHYDLWCFLWYYAGPNWGQPLKFHDINEKWQAFLTRLGPKLTERLGLRPTERAVLVHGVTVTATFIESFQPPSCSRLFVITPRGERYLPRNGFGRTGEQMFHDFVVEIWTGCQEKAHHEA
jgi:mannosyltransferase